MFLHSILQAFGQVTSSQVHELPLGQGPELTPAGHFSAFIK